MDKKKEAGIELKVDKDDKVDKVEIDRELESLIPIFMKTREQDMGRLKQSISQHDFADISQLGHLLKGTCATYGFQKLAEIGKKLEVAALEKDLALVTQLASEFENYLRSVKIIYVNLH